MKHEVKIASGYSQGNAGVVDGQNFSQEVLRLFDPPTQRSSITSEGQSLQLGCALH